MSHKTDAILAGLHSQNEYAEFEGRKGFWCQGDCVFIEATDAVWAIMEYRKRLSEACIGISHNLFCDGILSIQRNEMLKAIRKDPSIGESLKEALEKTP